MKDDQENWIRIAERLHICQLSWLNTTVAEKKFPCISILRPNSAGVCGAAQLQVLEVLHGEFMVVPESVFWVSFSLFWALIFPVLSHMDIHITLLLSFTTQLCGLKYRHESKECVKEVKFMCSSNTCLV